MTEVVCDSVQFLEPKGQGGNQQQQYNNNSADSYTNAYGNQSTGSRPAPQQQSRQDNAEENPFANADGPVDISDDDLPF